MRNPFGTCILLIINALPLCFLLADGTFVAATVYGGNCKVFPGVPGADRGIYVFGSLYALRQYILRVGGIYGIRIGTVDYIGRRIPLIVVSGGLPGDFPISVGQLPDVELRGGGDEGKIQEENSPKEFFANPKNKRLREFLSKTL